MPDIQIQESGSGEIQAIIELAWKIWPLWYEPIIGPEQVVFMLDQIYNSENLTSQIQNGQIFYIISLKGKKVGFFSINPGKESTCRLEKLYLLPELIGIGIGKSILMQAENLAAGSSNKMQLNVNRFNPSLGFYLHQGYKIVSEVDIPFGPFFLNDFVLEKEIQIAQ
jgi:GNAT superfamily N-acetyltransferase